MFAAFPMILIAVILYNLVALGGWLGHTEAQALLDQGFAIKMFSNDMWRISIGDFFLLLTLCLLFVEVVRATATTKREIVNHAFSMLTFVVALVEFITLRGFATTVFFLITIMALFDVVAGYTISIVTAKRDLSVAPPSQG
jgi:hypothetical protein